MTRPCLPAWRSLVWVGLAVATIFAAPVARAEWAPFAYISATMGVSDSRICIGEASRGEIGCPSYAPTISPTGTLNTTGGLVTNAVSLTTAGTTWGYLTSTASYLPNLSTGSISASSLTVNGVSVTGAGASKLASLTDVSASSPANNSLLRYNTTSSKWEAVGLNSAVSTTTMVANWPDAILCSTAGGDPTILYYIQLESSSGLHRYGPLYGDTSNSDYSIGYNPDGSYNSTRGATYSNCANVSISSLYSSGRAFNFIGNNGTSISSTASGYALTSGTLSVTANSATSVVSLTTGATTWGYFGSAASYLPYLSGLGVSATNISVSTINGVSASNLGISKLASLTDVSASSPANNSLLRYNTTSSKWEAVGLNSAVSTTTMLAGWPDAIRCNSASGSYTFYLSFGPYSSLYYYRSPESSSSTSWGVVFNADGSWKNDESDTYTDCHTTISSLYSSGKAFNFIGNNGTSISSTASGYAITSGTLSITGL